MRTIARLTACALLCAHAALAVAQQPRPFASAEWVPMTAENDLLYKQARAGYEIAIAQAKQQAAQPQHTPGRKERDEAEGEPTSVPDTAGAPLGEGGGMSGPMGPDSIRSGGRGKEERRWLTLEELLPPSLDFAAPRTGDLILQRMSTAVLFGRSDSDEVVILPLSGDDTDIIHGMRASIHDVGGSLRLQVGLPTGLQVMFEYHQDPDPQKHLMSVDIRIGGGPPGTGIELKRLYRQAPARSGAPRTSD